MEKPIFRSAGKEIITPKLLGCITEDVLDNTGFFAFLATLVSSKPRQLIAKQVKIVAHTPQFVEAATYDKGDVPVMIFGQGKG